jgi:membrane protease YdiL (CAAX protease family)
VLRLLTGLFSSMLLGVLIVSGYESLAKEAGQRQKDLFLFVVGVFSFHGVGLVLVDVFVRQHRTTWREAFGFGEPRWGRALALALIVGIVILPIAWSLMEVSAKVLSLFDMPVEQQQAVKVLQSAKNNMDFLYHGVAAILIAPFVEELVFRGILYPAIKGAGFRKLALWGTSMFFALTHGNLMIFVPLTVLAIILTFLYETTNNLLAPIVTHSFFNAANFAYLLWQRHQGGGA